MEAEGDFNIVCRRLRLAHGVWRQDDGRPAGETLHQLIRQVHPLDDLCQLKLLHIGRQRVQVNEKAGGAAVDTKLIVQHLGLLADDRDLEPARLARWRLARRRLARWRLARRRLARWRLDVAHVELIEIVNERLDGCGTVAEVGAYHAGDLDFAGCREALALVGLVSADARVVDREGWLDGAVEAGPVALHPAGAPKPRRARRHAPLGRRGLRGLEQVLIPRLARMSEIAVDRDERPVRVRTHEFRELNEIDVEVAELRDVGADEGGSRREGARRQREQVGVFQQEGLPVIVGPGHRRSAEIVHI